MHLTMPNRSVLVWKQKTDARARKSSNEMSFQDRRKMDVIPDTYAVLDARHKWTGHYRRDHVISMW